DDVWVTGTLGDAAAALAQLRGGGTVDAGLRLRLDRPTPRVDTGLALAGLAHAAIDVSDGLLADLGHLCSASGVGAGLSLAALPASPPLRALAAGDALHALQASGGDDYELCFTADPARAPAIAALARGGPGPTRIGRIVAGAGVRAFRGDGSQWRPGVAGYAHFRGG